MIVTLIPQRDKTFGLFWNHIVWISICGTVIENDTLRLDGKSVLPPVGRDRTE